MRLTETQNYNKFSFRQKNSYFFSTTAFFEPHKLKLLTIYGKSPATIYELPPQIVKFELSSAEVSVPVAVVGFDGRLNLLLDGFALAGPFERR